MSPPWTCETCGGDDDPRWGGLTIQCAACRRGLPSRQEFIARAAKLERVAAGALELADGLRDEVRRLEGEVRAAEVQRGMRAAA